MLDICAPRAYGAALQMRIIRIARGQPRGGTALYTPLYRAYGAAHIGTPCRGTARREVITGGLLMTNQSKRMLDSSTPFPYNVYIELSQLEPKG